MRSWPAWFARTRLLLVAIVTLTRGLVAGPAVAGNAHVVNGPAITVNGNTLTITASIAGLGSVPSANLTLTGSLDALPSATTRVATTRPPTTRKRRTPSKSPGPSRCAGRTNVLFDVAPLSTLTCPGKQVVVIETVSYDLLLSGEGVDIHLVGGKP